MEGISGIIYLDVAETFDIQLIESCKKGNRAAQKILYDRLAPRMFPVCIRYIGDRTAAEDILQDGFITLFTRLDSYKGEGSFEGWARRIFVTTALMSLRKKDALKMSDELEAIRGIGHVAPPRLQNGVQHVRDRRVFSQGDCRDVGNKRDYLKDPVQQSKSMAAEQDTGIGKCLMTSNIMTWIL